MLGAGFVLPKNLDQPVLCVAAARRLLRFERLLRCNVMEKQALLRFIFAKSLILKLCYMLRLFSGLSQSYEVVRAPRRVQNIPHNQILQTSYNIF